MSKWIEKTVLNKANNGWNNLCGSNVAKHRKALRLSQRQLAVRLQLFGLDVDKNAIQRIECGKRFVTDIELFALASVFQTTLDALIQDNE